MVKNIHSRTLGLQCAALAIVAGLGATPVLAQQSPVTLNPVAAAARPPDPNAQTIALSQEQAVSMALESSLGLKSERMNLDLASQDIAAAHSAFLPDLSTSLTRNSSKSVPSDFTQGSTDITSQAVTFGGTVNQRLPWYGASYQGQWNGNRNTTIGGFPGFNPSLGSSVFFSFTQPLWRGLEIDATRAGLQRSEQLHTIEEIQLQQRIVTTETQARRAYLALLGAIKGREVAQQNMDLAEQELRNTQARVRVGQAPQIDIVTQEAQVASQREQLIVSEANVSEQEDNLRTVVLDPGRADYWQVHLEPTDPIELKHQDVDVDAAIRNALNNRLDLIALKRNMDITELNMRVSKDATHPSVDLGFTYAASGTGGTRITYGEGFPPPIVSTAAKGFGGVLGDAFSFAYPRWSLGVQVGYPLGRSTAEVTYTEAQIRQQQQGIDRRQLELDIVRQVRQAARDVQTTYERVQATNALLDASNNQLSAEERRFAVGLTDLFQLQTRQSQLASARVSQLNAVISYNNALIELNRVQKIQ